MNNLKRFSISAILFLTAYLALGTSTAMAALVFGYNNLTCYDNSDPNNYVTYDVSACSSGGGNTSSTAAAITLQATSETSTPSAPPPTETTVRKKTDEKTVNEGASSGGVFLERKLITIRSRRLIRMATW